MVLNDEAYLAPSLDQEICAPPEWNLGTRSRSNGTAMASLVGLKVEPLGPKQEWFHGLIICILPGICGMSWRDFRMDGVISAVEWMIMDMFSICGIVNERP